MVRERISFVCVSAPEYVYNLIYVSFLDICFDLLINVLMNVSFCVIIFIIGFECGRCEYVIC